MWAKAVAVRKGLIHIDHVKKVTRDTLKQCFDASPAKSFSGTLNEKRMMLVVSCAWKRNLVGWPLQLANCLDKRKDSGRGAGMPCNWHPRVNRHLRSFSTDAHVKCIACQSLNCQTTRFFNVFHVMCDLPFANPGSMRFAMQRRLTRASSI